MSEPMTKMRQEVLEIPHAAERLLTDGMHEIETAAQTLRNRNPLFLSTVARGSSDHVATFLKYASELTLGVPVASIGPSVASIYHAPLKLGHSACISVSQSGRSPDIVAQARDAGIQGAYAIAITNDADSPLAHSSHHTVPIHAGPELSVAATKTFVNSALAGLCMLAYWKDDADLIRAIHSLPEHLSRAAQVDWPEMCAAIGGRKSLFTLGRGPAYAMSNEAALKFKETSQLHAESYSSAEVLHGPVSIVEQGFPVLAMAAADAAEDVLVEVADQIATKGASVYATSAKARHACRLETIRTDHPLTDPLALIVSFYAMVEKVATKRGINPDRPRHLTKVTETV